MFANKRQLLSALQKDLLKGFCSAAPSAYIQHFRGIRDNVLPTDVGASLCHLAMRSWGRGESDFHHH